MVENYDGLMIKMWFHLWWLFSSEEKRRNWYGIRRHSPFFCCSSSCDNINAIEKNRTIRCYVAGDNQFRWPKNQSTPVVKDETHTKILIAFALKEFNWIFQASFNRKQNKFKLILQFNSPLSAVRTRFTVPTICSILK